MRTSATTWRSTVSSLAAASGQSVIPKYRPRPPFTGLYGQDTSKPQANITVTYGVRYDVERPPNANENSPFEYSRKFRTDKNNIAPRLGVAIGHGKTVIRASGGVFYDPFQTDLYRRALLNNGTPAFFAISAIPQLPFAPAFPTVFSGLPPSFTPTLQDITTVSR